MSETFARAELFVVLLAAMLGLTALARRLLVPYPILLVLGGLALAFIPGVPEVALEPDLVFVLFLPPILWGAAYFTSLRDFKRNLRSISGLAIGLVLLTTLVVGWVAHAIIPGMSWAVALCLGAIVSPPDAVAATAVMSRIGVPRTVISGARGRKPGERRQRAGALPRRGRGHRLRHVLARRHGRKLPPGGDRRGAGRRRGRLANALGRTPHGREATDRSRSRCSAPYVAWIAAERLHGSAVLACVAGGLYVRQHFSCRGGAAGASAGPAACGSC